MPDVRIKLPAGARIDRSRLTSAVRFALDGGDVDKIWRLNNVPAIAQLEEAVYDEGMQDLTLLYHEVTAGLGLPPDAQAAAVLQKGLSLFQEEEHPRDPKGAATPGYKPGEFVPKTESAPGPAPSDDGEAERLRQGADDRIASVTKLMKLAGPEKKAELQVRIDRIRQETEEEIQALREGRGTEKKPNLEPLPKAQEPIFRGDATVREGGRSLPKETPTGHELAAQFGLRAAFGHSYLGEDLREEVMRGAAGAFMDLADVLGLKDQELGLQGQLTFDVRGAAAGGGCQYQPIPRSIELVARKGGALSHEWWHAIDNAIGRQINPAGGREAYASEQGDLLHRDEPLHAAFRNLLSAITKSEFLRDAHSLGDVKRHPTDPDYWHRPIETTARAFECYVDDKLAAQGRKNGFLADTSTGNQKQYPHGADREKINQAFDALWATLRENRAMLKSLAAALAPEDAAAVYEDLAKAFRLGRKPEKGQTGFGGALFAEDDHPREKAGETLAGYKPGEFVPKDQEAGPDTQAEQESDLPAQEEAPLPSIEEQIEVAHARFQQQNKDLTERLSALWEHHKATADPAEQQKLKEAHQHLLDEQGVLFQRFRHEVNRLQIVQAGGAVPRTSDEMREAGRQLRAEDRDLSRQLVPLSDPRRVTLRTEMQRLFTQADRMDGMHGDYLRRLARKVGEEAAEKRRPWTQKAINPASDEERDLALQQMETISDDEIERTNELENRAVWQDEAEKERQENELRERLGAKEYNRIKAEEAAANDYLERHQTTDVGFDRRQPHLPRLHLQSVHGFRPIGRPMTRDDCEAAGLPRGSYDFNREEEKQAHEIRYLGGGFAVHGPRDDETFQQEAEAMRDRIEKAFPDWVRDHLQRKGVTNHFTAAAPARVEFDTQAEFYDWLKQNPELSNGCNPDRSMGVYYHSRKAAWTQVGASFYGSGTGSTCTELHEYAHALDYSFRDNGQPIHALPEWQQIVNDMAPYVSRYIQKPEELFAEGLTAFVWSKETRKQMLQGPPQWKRMGKFFQALLDDKRGPDQITKALWVPAWVTKSVTGAAGAGREETEPTEGWVWKPGTRFPAPDGNGDLIVDGYGPETP